MTHKWFQTSGIILFISIISLCFTACQSPQSLESPTEKILPETTDVQNDGEIVSSGTDTPNNVDKMPLNMVPSPTFEVAGTGAIIGKVMFPDNSPGYRSTIFIFEPSSIVSIASTYADRNGYYMFDNLFPGTYEIYAGNDPQSYNPVSSSYIGNPKAIVNVVGNKVTDVPSFTLLRNVPISLDDPKNNWQTVSISGARNAFENMIKGNMPIFSWDIIPNASKYTVDVWSTEFSTRERKEYTKQQAVNTNSVIWTDNLSLLPYKEYIVEVVAYLENDQPLARGYWKFFIDTPPSGWELVK